MRIALIVDAYAPARTSAAVQMSDLAHELRAQGHEPAVVVPSTEITSAWDLKVEDGVRVLRVRSPATKDIGYVKRTVAELRLPFAMWRGLSMSPLAAEKWDGVVWYSPTIFFGPLVKRIKRSSQCPSYLILRDLFPDWAVDAGVMRRGPTYRFFKRVERYQYSVADTIGVQTPANLKYLASWPSRGRRLEVLHNWLTQREDRGAPIAVSKTSLRGRKIFVYAGNMGRAQDVGPFLDLAGRLRTRRDVGFLFVGRGSEAGRLKARALKERLENVEFHDEIAPSEVPGLLSQCHIGILALDPRHTTHNIPGKFLTYLRAGLPVLARINPGNDLEKLIQTERLGRVSTESSVDVLEQMAGELLDNEIEFAEIARRARTLANQMFSVTTAATQVISALRSGTAHFPTSGRIASEM